MDWEKQLESGQITCICRWIHLISSAFERYLLTQRAASPLRLGMHDLGFGRACGINSFETVELCIVCPNIYDISGYLRGISGMSFWNSRLRKTVERERESSCNTSEYGYGPIQRLEPHNSSTFQQHTFRSEHNLRLLAALPLTFNLFLGQPGVQIATTRMEP